MTNEAAQKAVLQWLKSHKKKTFYLESTDLNRHGKTRYYIIWNETKKGVTKTKFGYVEDGMWTRYGLTTLAATSSDNPFDVWKDSGLTADTLKTVYPLMMDVRNGSCKLPVLDLNDLKELQF